MRDDEDQQQVNEHGEKNKKILDPLAMTMLVKGEISGGCGEEAGMYWWRRGDSARLQFGGV